MRKESVTYKEVELTVEFEFIPEEPMVWTDRNGDPGHPGSPAEYNIDSVLVGGVNIYDILTESQLEDIEGLLADKLESDSDY